MAEYRSPAEDRANDEQRARVSRVIDQAVEDGASLLAAMELEEPQEVIETWTDKVWGGLRDGLTDEHPEREDCPNLRADEDRLMAIVVLLEDRMLKRADAILRSVRAVGRG